MRIACVQHEDKTAPGAVRAWAEARGHDFRVVRSQLGEGFFPQRLDWVFARGPLVITPGTAIDVEGSDHLPLAFDVAP